jgi:EcsC protein family
VANPLTKMKSQAGKVAVSAIDHVVVNRFHDAESLLDRARKAQPHGTRTQVADAIISRVSKEMAAVGAASGAVAAAPAVGTAASVATTAADIGLAFGRIATMVMAVGLAYGHDLSDVDQRKVWVYDVLSGSHGQLTDSERKAGDLKKQLGDQALGSKGGPSGVNRINEIVATRIGSKMVGRLVSEEVALKIATLLPLGVGAGIGAVGNRALVRSIGRHAKTYFDTWPKGALVEMPRRT